MLIMWADGGLPRYSGDCIRSWKKRKSPPGKNADDNKQRKRQKAADGKAVQAGLFPLLIPVEAYQRYPGFH